MPVITAVKKRIPTRMILWDGTAKCAEEIRAFVGRDAPDGSPNFRILNEAAEIFDKLHPTWIPVPLGSYVVEGVDGENYPIAGDVFARTYDVVSELAAPPDADDAPRFSWTQPLCNRCWDQANPGRPPARVTSAEPEVCVTCGGPTASGIYIRINPANAAHPTLRNGR